MGKQIKILREYPHPVEDVWQAISTSEALGEWLMPNNFALIKGHRFQFRTKPQPGFDGIVNCQVVDFEVHQYLKFSWQGGPLKKPTFVTFQLDRIPYGTRLTFTHSGFEGLINEYIVRFILGSGWKKLLAKKIIQYLDR